MLHTALAVVVAMALAVTAPPTQFVLEPDGSSGRTTSISRLPTMKAVKKTIAVYYGDPGTGIADKADSPYIDEMQTILAKQEAALPRIRDAALARGEKPAIVLDVDDTTLLTYDLEVGVSDYDFSRASKNDWVKHRRFPATPGMLDFVATAESLGFTVFGITGRSDSQKSLTLANLRRVGYDDFVASRFFARPAGKRPAYLTCRTATCTTVEFKSLTRKYIEKLGYDIELNVGDQWSDLQGGHADRTLKLPNPTYVIAGIDDPKLTPRIRFTMKADGSSGLTAGGEGIPNHDVVEATLAIARQR